MKLFNILLTLFTFAFATFNTTFAIDPNKIVGGTVSRKLPSYSSASKSPYSSKRSANIMSLYRGSKHERALDAQIRNYRASARKNAEVFGRGYSSSSRKPNSHSSDQIVIIDNKRFKVTLGSGGNILLSPLK